MSEREFADALREQTLEMFSRDCFMESRLREMVNSDWVVIKSVHRDSDFVDRSNYEVMTAMLDELGADYEDHRFSHWAVGWMDHLVVRVRTGNRLRKQLLREIASCYDALEDYPLLDEEHHSQMEWDAHEEGLCNEYCPHCESLRQEHLDGQHHQLHLLRFDDDGEVQQLVEGCVDCEEDLRHHENYCMDLEDEDGLPYYDESCEICQLILRAKQFRTRALFFAQQRNLPV
jgi:hypothetical protein